MENITQKKQSGTLAIKIAIITLVLAIIAILVLGSISYVNHDGLSAMYWGAIGVGALSLGIPIVILFGIKFYQGKNNEKPRMYLSWKTVLLNSLIMILALSFVEIVLGIASIIVTSVPDPYTITVPLYSYPWGTYAVIFILPISIILFISIASLFVNSFFKKQNGYIHTKSVDRTFIFSSILAVIVTTFMISFAACFESASIFCLISSEGLILLLPIIAVIIAIMLALSLNRKFEKPETELGLPKS